MIRKKKRVIHVRFNTEVSLQELQYIRRHRVLLQQITGGQYTQHQYGRYHSWFQGQVLVYTTTAGFCKPEQLESVRRVFIRQLVRLVRFWERCHFNGMVTAKPSEVRMGQGKGRFKTWVQPFIIGSPVFELSSSLRFSLSYLRFLVVRSRFKFGFAVKTAYRAGCN